MKGKPQNKNCPVCGECLDINTFVPGESTQEPLADIQPDDVTFCFKCRTVLVFNDALNIVTPDPETLYYVLNDPAFIHFVNQIDDAMRTKPNLN